MGKSKRNRKNKVLKVWTLDEDNLELLAGKLNQPVDRMVKALLIAQINDREIHIVEYNDRFELSQTAAGS